MNFIFISPNSPGVNRLFCQSLRNNQVKVLGIGEENYDLFANEIKHSLTDYYQVSSLKNYEEIYKGCAYFIHKYGRIDLVESLNQERQLTDARLRTDFNIPGLKETDFYNLRKQSEMKKYFQKAEVSYPPSTFLHGIDSQSTVEAFLAKYGFPVVIKPDENSDGTETFILNNAEEVKDFRLSYPEKNYLLEKFVSGQLVSVDGITDSQANILYCAAHYLPLSLLEIVGKDLDVYYYTFDLTPEIRLNAQKIMHAFGARKCFFHLEYFLLDKDQEYLGTAGEVVAFKMHFHPGAASIPDMINYAADLDIYQYWADVVCFDTISAVSPKTQYYCGYFGRKNKKMYRHSEQNALEKYGRHFVLCKEIADNLQSTMGKNVYIFRDQQLETIKEIISYLDE